MSSMLVRLPSGLVAMATTSSSVGKKARNRLNAIAWESMLQRGNTRPSIFKARLSSRPSDFIGWHYTCPAFLLKPGASQFGFLTYCDTKQKIQTDSLLQNMHACRPIMRIVEFSCAEGFSSSAICEFDFSRL